MPPSSRGHDRRRTPPADPQSYKDILDRVNGLGDIIKDLSQIVRSKDAPGGAEELFDDYMLLVDHQVEKALAEEICKTLHRTAASRSPSAAVVRPREDREQLEKLLPVSGPIARTKTNGPHVVALIGPTGVGKTRRSPSSRRS